MSQRQKMLTVIRTVLLAGMLAGGFGLVQIQLVYAQQTGQTGNVVDAGSAAIYAIGAFIGAVAVLLTALGPIIKRFNKKIGEGLEDAGTEAAKWGHYTITLAEQVKKNKATYQTLKEAILASGHATPELRAAIEEAEKHLESEFNKIEAEADKQRTQIEKIQTTIPGRVLSEDEVNEERRL